MTFLVHGKNKLLSSLYHIGILTKKNEIKIKWSSCEEFLHAKGQHSYLLRPRACTTSL